MYRLFKLSASNHIVDMLIDAPRLTLTNSVNDLVAHHDVPSGLNVLLSVDKIKSYI